MFRKLQQSFTEQDKAPSSPNRHHLFGAEVVVSSVMVVVSVIAGLSGWWMRRLHGAGVPRGKSAARYESLPGRTPESPTQNFPRRLRASPYSYVPCSAAVHGPAGHVTLGALVSTQLVAAVHGANAGVVSGQYCTAPSHHLHLFHLPGWEPPENERETQHHWEQVAVHQQPGVLHRQTPQEGRRGTEWEKPDPDPDKARQCRLDFLHQRYSGVSLSR